MSEGHPLCWERIFIRQKIISIRHLMAEIFSIVVIITGADMSIYKDIFISNRYFHLCSEKIMNFNSGYSVNQW